MEKNGSLSWLTHPLIQLSNAHKGEVYTCKFRKDGYGLEVGPILATGGYDKNIVLWNCTQDCKMICAFQGHSGPILDLQWSSDGVCLYSASSDTTLSIWDIEYCKKIRRLRGHSDSVNTCTVAGRIQKDIYDNNGNNIEVGSNIIISGSDDGNVKVWDPREHKAIKTIRIKKGPVTSVEFNQSANGFFTAGLDNTIKYWDLRNIRKPQYIMTGHLDSITGIRLNPDGNTLVSTSMDNTVRVWDVSIKGKLNDQNDNILSTRMTSIFEGAPHGMEKNLIKPCWSPDGDFIACGSSDRTVMIWDYLSEKPVYKLPGHKGSVNQVDWIGNVLASCSNDGTILLGEIDLDDVR